jgi:hypothetical protein
MKTAYVITGRITLEGKLELDEQAPLPPGPVRVSVESLDPLAVNGDGLSITDAEWQERKKIMDRAVGCISDEQAERILRIIEEEFEQVNLDRGVLPGA